MKFTIKEYIDQIINSLQKSIENKFYSKEEINDKFDDINISTGDSSGPKIPQIVKLNVKNGDNFSVNLLNENKNNDLIIQGYEFVEGDQDVVSTLKEFNNSEEENFNYNKKNISFDNGMHVKNSYNLVINKNETTGYYESEIINKDNYLELLRIEVNN